MQALGFQTPQVLVPSMTKKFLPVSVFKDLLPCRPSMTRRTYRPPSSSSSSSSLRFREESKPGAGEQRTVQTLALNVGNGSNAYEEKHANNHRHSTAADVHQYHSENSSKIEPSLDRAPYLFPTSLVLCACTIGFLLVLSIKVSPSILPALAKSGLTAAFSLIFVSEIGDKTFFIAALLAMQYDKLLVLVGSMAALSIMTILSVVIGRIFLSVPAQFQTTLPIGEYAAVILMMFFGLRSIKDAWDLPSTIAKAGESENKESDEFTEAEELLKEKVSKRLSNPLEVLWKSFGLVFFAEWGDRSMLATIALSAAQSPVGVASGAVAGHLLATFIAILGGAFLAEYISEKLVGYIGGFLFLVFAVATFFGVF